MLLARRFDGGDMRCFVLGCVVAAVMAAPAVVAGQWLKYPMEGLPRNADGSLNRNAPAPRLPDGRPDFSVSGTPLKSYDRMIRSRGK